MKRRMLALFLALFLGIALTGCADVQSNNGPYSCGAGRQSSP